MDNRRDFLKKASFLATGAGMINMVPSSILKAMAIDPVAGSTYLDAEHVVFLMQENRSFDHTYGTLQGVRGFNDPRAITLPNKNPVWLQSNAKGETYAPFRLNIKDTNATWMSSLPHGWTDQVDARNNGKYDKWLDSKGSGHEDYKGMPLTMGYYSREDIPFYYALADAFTVCDHNFCSSLTGTTPNRLHFWSGTIRHKDLPSSTAKVWNGDADYGSEVDWETFPERLEDNGISWKVYQNEISVGVGFEGEQDSWLGNFTDNPLEFFKQYNVKLSAAYIAHLPNAGRKLEEEIKEMQAQLATLQGEELEKMHKRLERFKKDLITNAEEQENFTIEKYNALSQRDKNIHDKAFSSNKNDPQYHDLDTLKYKDGDTERQVEVPKGDVLHEFREDVSVGRLPTVSWIVAPENFSDHPSSAWYGAWYISEVMDILTKNPEVWKKTIFVLAYDENDGYFDHLPPFVAPGAGDFGAVSAGIDTSIEFVSKDQQSTNEQHNRESPIGLGYRVPLVIASPWSRGGRVCSEVFDHTSSLRFLEKFLEHKTGKRIIEKNISEWRRTVCGDLSSVFKPYTGEQIMMPAFLQRDQVIESIHRAKFKSPPSNFRNLSTAEIEEIKKAVGRSPLLPTQEKGIRTACPLPYELYADGHLAENKQTFIISLSAANEFFKEQAAGSPFNVYAPGIYKLEPVRAWSYAVKAGDELMDKWELNDFENGHYHLQVYGPNGFFREFAGHVKDPELKVVAAYDKRNGNILLRAENLGITPLHLEIVDNAYKRPKLSSTLAAGKLNALTIDLKKSYQWYDFTVKVKGDTSFMKRYAGHVETGRESKTDPAMGGLV